MPNIGVFAFQINQQEKFYFANLLISPKDTNAALIDSSSYIEASNEEFSGLNIKEDIEVFELITNKTSSSKNLFIVDKGFNIYYTDVSGNILWTYKIDSPIISEIQELDYYKNGKSQLIFNTKKSIYIIDKLGKDIDGYPFSPKNEITNGLSVFDFDKKKDYRIIFAAKNNIIENIGLDRKNITGWNSPKTFSNVFKQVKYARIAGVDLLIVYQEENKILIFDRRGKLISSTKDRFMLSANNNFSLTNNKGTACFVNTTKDGEIVYIYSNGKTDKRFFNKFSSSHFYCISDINNDNNPEYIFADGNNLYVYKGNGSLLFQKEFPSKIKHAIKVININMKYIEITTADKIYLIDKSGSVCEGFPFSGTSKFYILDVNNDKKLEVLVANNKTFLIYQAGL